MKITEQISKIPIGTSEFQIGNRKYLVTKKDYNNGKSTKVYAAQLGGKDFISFNFYKTSTANHLKPCEMPHQKVLDFLKYFG